MRATLIVNPMARKASKARSGETLGEPFHPEEALEREGIQVTVRETAGPAHATGLAADAAREGAEAVILCAGDGTVREAIDGLADTGVPLGVIPWGTGNVLARHLGLPLDPRRACRAIANASVREVDLGEANGKRFVLHASAGGGAEVVRRLPPGRKRRWGQPAFVWTALGVVARRMQWDVEVEGDEDAWEGRAWDVIVGNAAAFAWKLRATPHALMDDGVLDVCILKWTSPWRLLWTAFKGLFGMPVRADEVVTFRSRHVLVRAEPAAPVQADGDVIGETPVEIRVLPRALRLMVPRTAS
jgi:YegS/Rv2252/BmrU family lipid kinase